MKIIKVIQNTDKENDKELGRSEHNKYWKRIRLSRSKQDGY